MKVEQSFDRLTVEMIMTSWQLPHKTVTRERLDGNTQTGFDGIGGLFMRDDVPRDFDIDRPYQVLACNLPLVL